MRKEKMIADELQCMFLNGELHGFKEEYINFVSRKLRTGEIKLSELVKEDSNIKEKVHIAYERLRRSYRAFH